MRDCVLNRAPAASPAVCVEGCSRGERGRARLRTTNELGSSVIEVALVMPILLLVVTGICTFGIALNNYLMLTESTSIGARLLAISRQQTTDPCAYTVPAIYNAAPLLTQANFSFHWVFTEQNGTVDGTYNGTTCTAAAAYMQQGEAAQVTVTYPCSLAVYGVNYSPGCTLKAQTTELIQ